VRLCSVVVIVGLGLRTIISNGGLVVVGNSDMPLLMFEREVRLSWQQTFGEGPGFYIEPGTGAGGVHANPSVDVDDSLSVAAHSNPAGRQRCEPHATPNSSPSRSSLDWRCT
jgi:hypothetical protein